MSVELNLPNKMEVINDTTIRLRPHVIELASTMSGFQLIDYCIFIAMLVISTSIGIYFGYKEKQKNQNTRRRRDSIEQDYLVGGRNLKIFPVAMSLAATFISGIHIVGISAEVYVYGTQFVFALFVVIVPTLAVHYMFIPVFHDLKVTSMFEYLEARFDKRLRLLTSTLFITALIIWLPIVFYATALAFNQMSGINIHIITPITCSICIFYTLFGGMKAVVWSDVFQTVIMYGTMLLIVIKCTLEIGLDTIWDRNLASGRIELPEMTIDPFVRHSIISILIGGMFFWAPIISTNQMFMQRYVSLATVNEARKALWLFIFTVVTFLAMCCFCGLLAYAKYYDCDPLSTKLVKSKDQVLPVLVADLFRNVPGISGIFVSGIFSAALSTLSTALNSLSALILEDFFKKIMNKPPSVRMTNYIMRSTVFTCGFICVGLVFIVEKLGSILQLAMSLNGAITGPIFAINLMGLIMPRINGTSALIGGTGSLLFMIYMVVRAQLDQAAGKISFITKPVATDSCPYEFDEIDNGFSNATIPVSEEGLSPPIHHISYLYYTVIGTLLTMLISTVVSYFVKHDANEVRPELLAPFIRKFHEYDVPEKQLLEVVHHFDNIKLSDTNNNK